MVKLSELELRVTKILTLDPLSVTQLNSLVVRISSVKALRNMTELTKLDLSWNLELKNISSLFGLTKLTSLDLSLNGVFELGPLAGLKMLKLIWEERKSTIDRNSKRKEFSLDLPRLSVILVPPYLTIALSCFFVDIPIKKVKITSF
jgi:Leucine-rich repeat (LRR) protein